MKPLGHGKCDTWISAKYTSFFSVLRDSVMISDFASGNRSFSLDINEKIIFT